MAWPTRSAESVLSGENAETIGSDLFARDETVFDRGTHWDFDATSSTSFSTNATFDTIETQRWLVPPWVGSGDVMHVGILLRTSLATEQAEARLVHPGDSVTGAAVTSTSTSFEVVTMELTATSGTWADTVQEFEIQVRNDTSLGVSATAYASVSGLLTNLWWEV